jgi:hypothetical protein
VSRKALSKTGILLLPALIFAGCAGEPTIQTGEDAETVLGTLNKVDNSRVDLAYIDPNGDYARYKRVYISPLDVDNVEIIQPSRGSSMLNRFNKEWELTDRDKQDLQAAFKDAAERQLTAGGAYSLAEELGDDVLRVDAMITSIAPTAPKDDATSRSVGRTEVYTSSSAAISIAMAIADGDSGEILAIVKDTKRSNNNTWGINNRVTNLAEAKRDFTTWTRLMHDGLLELRARAETGGN